MFATLKITQIYMKTKQDKIRLANKISILKIANFLLLFILPLKANAELWVVPNSIAETKITFLKNSYNIDNGNINEFGVYHNRLTTTETGNGFFVHNDISVALGSLGVNLLNSNIKRQSNWAIKDRGLAGYGYRYNEEAAMLFGLNLPNSRIQDSAYISFTVGRSW